MATAVQSAIELSFSNLLVGFILIIAFLGEISYPTLQTRWDRGSAALWALIKAPGRWRWVGRLDWANAGIGGAITRGIAIGLPSLLLLIVFTGLLGSGNAILGTWISKWTQNLVLWIQAIDISFAHLSMDAVLATLALVLISPSKPSPRSRSPKLPRIQPNLSIAWWRSAVILGSLNALFFVANTIDAIYLWVHTELPEGVTPSQFVHQGVNGLIGAVVFSALVLTILFQQSLEISSSKILKRLGYGWIVQNLILISSVLLRLIRYVQACQLSTQRVYVGCFLILVTIGFGLIGWFISRNHSVRWLLMGNALATFCLFFCLQFPDVSGWVANFNVAHSKHLDIEYLEQLGPSAWPALVQVESSNRPDAPAARQCLWKIKAEERAKSEDRNWRSWQWRHAARVAELLPAS